MNDPNKQLFDNYARHHERAGFDRLPEDLGKLKRDRLPRWIDEVPRNSRILDAGCAQGHLLAALQRVGFTDLTGVDLSSQLLQTASRLVPCARLIESNIRDFLAGCPDGAFDVIFFHDVLEHLPREVTIPLLQAFYRVLAPGGRLSLRVPNLGALTGGQIAASDFTHITHFTDYSLMQVLEAAGFDLTRVCFECQAPRLFWSWRKPHRAFFRFLNRLRWHLNNGVHLAVYLLADFRPRPTVFDITLLVTARK
jgi:SAM-dependent methyltransferase